MRWVLNVTDSGPSPLRFVALAHQSGASGCEHTIENPRSRVDVSGVLNYSGHSAGQTSFSFDPKHYSCGRVQVDVSIFDAQGRETLIIGMVVDYRTACAPPPPPPPSSPLLCVPGGQTANAHQVVNLSATGGTGVYEWSSLGAPARGAGATFATAFGSAGTYSVVVTSGNATAACVVDVTVPPPPPPVVQEVYCSPATRSVSVNEVARLSASGGNGQFSWSGGGAPATGTTATFDTAFASAGTYPVTVTSGGATATCHVTVATPPPPPPPALVCSPERSSVLPNQAVTLNAHGGTGTYAWSGGGSPAGGSGASFTTAFGSAGTHTVTVTSGNATAACAVTVTPPPVTELYCGPQTQTVGINQRVTALAQGGDGTYVWTIDIEGGSPSTGTGPSFTTQFSAKGVYNLYVHSAGQRSKCRVIVD